MGRPSVQKERKAQVMEAFLTCAARHGIEGATLERIAAEAGLSRPLIRHHLGNRDAMVSALAEYVLAAFRAALDELRAAMAQYPGAESFVRILFDRRYVSDPRLTITYQALVHNVADHPELRQELLDTMQEFYDLTADAVQQDSPERTPEDCEAIGHAIASLYITSDSLIPLDPPQRWTDASLRAALGLIGRA